MNGAGEGEAEEGRVSSSSTLHHFCPISFTHFIPPLHVSPSYPALSSSRLVSSCPAHPAPPHPTPLPIPLYPPLRPPATVAPLLAVPFPPLTVAAAILHRRLNGRPPALWGCITEWLRMASAPSRSVFLCFFFPCFPL